MRALALILMLLAAPVHAASYMVGTWFGHGQPDDKGSMYIDRMKPDGSWRGEYRSCAKGKALDQVQVGRWSLIGDMLTLEVQTVDGRFAPRADLYKMLSHDTRSQKYVSESWHYTYTPQRVEDGFKMPSCELIS
ncbi:MAG TPA: hypothetical protein VGC16_06960 [Rhizomicrobium sp.]